MKKRIDQTLTKRADAAFQLAAQQVIRRARQTATPVIVWEDEAVKELDPPATETPRERTAEMLHEEDS